MYLYYSNSIVNSLVVSSMLGVMLASAQLHANERDKGIEIESVVLRLFAEAEVPAQEGGLLKKVLVREGDRVETGRVLAQIDDEVARLAVEAAERQYEIARAEATNDVRRRYAQKALEVSEAELRRSTESIERVAKSVSESQLDVERLTVQKNRLEAEQAQHETTIATLEMNAKKNELEAARAQVERRKIVAPFDGIVVQVYAREGEWVEPGQKALRIVNVDRLKAEGFVAAVDATPNLVGVPVQLTLSSTETSAASFAGTIEFVSPEVDPITGQVRVWAEIDNRDGRLRPGLPARMRVVR